MVRGCFMKMVFAIGLTMSGVLLAGCAGYSPYEGPLVDMAGVDQNRYNTDLSECRTIKKNATFVGNGRLITECMTSRGYKIIEPRG